MKREDVVSTVVRDPQVPRRVRCDAAGAVQAVDLPDLLVFEVNLYVYQFPSFDNLQYVTDAYNKVVSDNLVDSANSSFGGCEDAFETDALAWDQVARQGVTKGITFHASTGDYGSDPCFTGYNNVIAPASSPYFAAIGGTSFQVYNLGNYRSETVWNTDDYVATGGGVSDVFPLPPVASPCAQRHFERT